MLRPSGNQFVKLMCQSSKKAVFLDRDGVINRAIIIGGKPYSPMRFQDFQLIETAESCVNRLKSAGYFVAIVTNQPEVSRGNMRLDELDKIHNFLTETLSIDEIKVCPHDDVDQCTCRKPKPGMLLSASMDHELNLASSFMVGDRWKDIAAGNAAGCKTIWLNNEYLERQPENMHYSANCLEDAVDIILEYGNANG